MGEATEHLTKICFRVNVNENFGSYDDLLGLLGNIWIAQQIFFDAEPESTLGAFCVLLGNALCVPTIKRWVLYPEGGNSRYEVAYAILNTVEQAFLLATRMFWSRRAIMSVVAGNWADVDPTPYEEIGHKACALPCDFHN